MARKATAKEEFLIEIKRLERATVEIYILGENLCCNRMPKKAKETLLLPARMTNRRGREAVLKHNPPEEFRDSIYRCRDDKAPTYLHMPNGAFKKAMAQTAVDIPGATKAEIGRLVQVIDETVHVWGKPYLYMDIVRQAGINRTPDVRTRAMLPVWAAKITVQYIRSLIREQDVINLMDSAGLICGVGDGRTEKGTFNYGAWELVSANDKHWHEIVKTQGRALQQHAMEHPEPLDEDTAELLSWFHAEIHRRELDDHIAVAPQLGNGRKRRRQAEARPA